MTGKMMPGSHSFSTGHTRQPQDIAASLPRPAGWGSYMPAAYSQTKTASFVVVVPQGTHLVCHGPLGGWLSSHNSGSRRLYFLFGPAVGVILPPSHSFKGCHLPHFSPTDTLLPGLFLCGKHSHFRNGFIFPQLHGSRLWVFVDSVFGFLCSLLTLLDCVSFVDTFFTTWSSVAAY